MLVRGSFATRNPGDRIEMLDGGAIAMDNAASSNSKNGLVTEAGLVKNYVALSNGDLGIFSKCPANQIDNPTVGNGKGPILLSEVVSCRVTGNVPVPEILL